MHAPQGCSQVPRQMWSTKLSEQVKKHYLRNAWLATKGHEANITGSIFRSHTPTAHQLVRPYLRVLQCSTSHCSFSQPLWRLQSCNKLQAVGKAWSKHWSILKENVKHFKKLCIEREMVACCTCRFESSEQRLCVWRLPSRSHPRRRGESGCLPQWRAQEALQQFSYSVLCGAHQMVFACRHDPWVNAGERDRKGCILFTSNCTCRLPYLPPKTFGKYACGCC